MLDFVEFSITEKKGVMEIAPEFIIKKSRDLMTRGGDFYAVWVEEEGRWSTDEDDLIRLVDDLTLSYVKEHPELNLKPKKMRFSSSGVIDKWHKYCQKQCRDNFHVLDETIVFAGEKPKKTNYSSKSLPYRLEPGVTDAYDELMETLYSPEERHKIEWAIGAVVTGDSKWIQKFLVLYGSAGTGKGTVLKIISLLFEGYWTSFEAKTLGQANNAFALEAFKCNPLVAIQFDGDLSRIEDNTKLNSLVSHEAMTVNNKFEKQYSQSFKAMLFMGTNKPVKITDAKSGILRRLIDVTPTGNKIPVKRYDELMESVEFELGAIASKCKDVYLKNPKYYNGYVPTGMMAETNIFYDFVEDSFLTFKEEDSVTLKRAWDMYKTYCDYAKVQYPFNRMVFKAELRNYFDEFYDRFVLDSGERVRSYYRGFKVDKFDKTLKKEPEMAVQKSWIKLKVQNSLLDTLLRLCRAQIAGEDDKPTRKWSNVNKPLSELDTRSTHFVLPQDSYENLICIDFDLKGDDGEKSFERNVEAASKWPKTYAEVSKGGKGLHLYYFYDGDDVSKLASEYAPGIEVKVFKGMSALRRRVSLCNTLEVAHINSGLPFKKERKKMVNEQQIKSEKSLRELIIRNIRKEIHPGTKPSIDFIVKILEDAYNSGLSYDVSDMRNAITAFAAGSTNNATYCLKAIDSMKFTSADKDQGLVDLRDDLPKGEDKITFFDIEIFPNLFVICYMNEDDTDVKMLINPSAAQVEKLIRKKLVGFNNRRYDNHIIYAAYMGYSVEQLYKLSQKIISGESGVFFGEAYNISYADVYDYAAKKQSLKKWEIELGIHHQELGLPWDKPVPKELWNKVAEYCCNDVVATKAAWEATKGDFAAREILADLAGGIVNDTTNSLTTKIIFGKNRKPQDQFCYRDLAKPVFSLTGGVMKFLKDTFPKMMADRHGAEGSLLPYFPGYEFENGKSTYRGEEVGEGGYVYSEPGMYGRIDLLDVVSMHPHSTMLECLFGPEFTRRFYEIVYARVDIKHEAWDMVDKMLDGRLSPYIKEVKEGRMSKDALSTALKVAINSVYGLTAAGFENPFRDPRNVDNIVAKRGALFMIDLKHAVQEKGFTVAHIKTDSIKIADATDEIIQFVKDFGEKYGYTFEHEATYEKMCLVNDAVYIAKYKGGKHDGEWTATGTQFAVPYVFKTLFSGEALTFDDYCETKSVTTSIYLDMNEELTDVSQAEKDLAKYTKAHKDGKLEEELFLKLKTSCEEDIAKGHNYQFIGRVGRFTPVKDGYGGGILVREKDGKFYAVAGTKKKDGTPFKWLESEELLEYFKDDWEKVVDKSYYEALAMDAVDTISKYGDFESFAGHFVNVYPFDENVELPFD